MQPVYEDLAFCIFSGMVMMIVAVVVKIVLCCVGDDDVDHDDTGNVCFMCIPLVGGMWCNLFMRILHIL